MPFYHHIHCKYAGIKGFLTVYNDAVRYQYMLTEKAKYKAKILVFWEKHGLEACLDAFPVKRSTLYLWKQQWEQGRKRIESLNEKSKAPRTKRKRIWDYRIIQEVKGLRDRDNHPNLGSEKIHPLLKEFCQGRGFKCPQPRTIARIIADAPDKMRVFPQKISHFGKIKKANRQKVLRKPRDLKPEYPGHLVALDTIERIVNGNRRYIITFEDIYTRFSFAWATKSHASKAAEEFFELCLKVFPLSFNFLYVLTDNGSEFKKHFSEKLKELHLIHFHTYPKTPKMNAHVERFNRTIQEEFVDYHSFLLLNPDDFNKKLIDYLIFYNTKRVHWAFQNKLTPVQFMLSIQPAQLTLNMPLESKIGWHHTFT